MKRLIGCAALALLAGFLFQATASGEGGAQEPYWYHGKATMVIEPTGYWAYMESDGVGNHLGLGSSNFATGILDAGGNLTGTGTVTTTNGDQICYTFAGPMSGGVVITLTGGTGRFADVTGEMTLAPLANVETTQHGPLTILRGDSAGEGWISY